MTLVNTNLKFNIISEPMINEIRKKEEFLKNYSNMKINYDLYRPEILTLEPWTLKHRLENRKAKLVYKYVDE